MARLPVQGWAGAAAAAAADRETLFGRQAEQRSNATKTLASFYHGYYLLASGCLPPACHCLPFYHTHLRALHAQGWAVEHSTLEGQTAMILPVAAVLLCSALLPQHVQGRLPCRQTGCRVGRALREAQGGAAAAAAAARTPLPPAAAAAQHAQASLSVPVEPLLLQACPPGTASSKGAARITTPTPQVSACQCLHEWRRQLGRLRLLHRKCCHSVLHCTALCQPLMSFTIGRRHPTLCCSSGVQQPAARVRARRRQPAVLRAKRQHKRGGAHAGCQLDELLRWVAKT